MNPETNAGLASEPEDRQALIAKYLQTQADRREFRIRRRDAGVAPPVSWGQQQILLHSELAAGVPIYNEAVTIHRYGPLDVSAFRRALKQFVQRHEIMRTAFRFVNGGMIQAVQPAVAVHLPIEDLENLPERKRESEAIRIATADVRRRFNVTTGPLFRLRLIRFHACHYRLLLALHHTVFDGSAITDVLLPELVSLYEGALSRAPTPLVEPELQYGDYACWQRENVTPGRLPHQLEYWRRNLEGGWPRLDLPTDYPRPITPSFRGAMVPFRIPAEVVEALALIARDHGATPYIVLLAAFYVLLYRYTSQEDIVVGSIQSVRNRSELERVMGFFLNALALRVDLAGNPPFVKLLARVRNVTLEAFSHADIPFTELVRRFDSKKDPGRSPFFDAFFSMNPALAGNIPGWDVTHQDADVGISKFDLHLEMDGRPDGIAGRFLFRTDLFARSSIERMANNWETLLAGIVAAPDMGIDQLPILPEPVRRRILFEWNDTQRSFAEAPIHALVEAQVGRTPEGEAIVFERQHLSYRELNERANRLAAWLLKNGAGRDVLIGICMERSVEMAVALLAVLKSGAAYLPLDPDNPSERQSQLLEDGNPRVILTQAKFSTLAAFQNRQFLALDLASAILQREAARNPDVHVRPEDLAYVIYTSGSSGKPKAVMIPHGAICNRLRWMQEAWPLSSSDRVLQKTPFYFDVSVPEVFGTWIAGAKLVIARPGAHRDAASLAELIISHHITQVHFVPSQLQFFLEEPRAAQCRSLRRVLCSGEALTVDLERSFHARLNATLINLYGPTEASVEVSSIERKPSETGPMTIGRPIANTKLYILDQNLQPVPIGAAGGIYIGGVQTARGYLNSPELTAERFLRDPFDTSAGARIYRTGDRGRFLENGQIQFLGRLDGQVKIRGLRVELGEIEAAIQSLRGLSACAVVVETAPNGQQSLVAYIASNGVPIEKLDQHLRRLLPQYMVPQRYVRLDRISLTPSGKLDRRALSAAAATNVVDDGPAAEARNEIEGELARIWKDVLRINSIGNTQDFFALGGNSLLVTRLIRRMERKFGQRYAMASVFQAPTIEKLARLMAKSRAFLPGTRVASIQPNGSRPPLFVCMDGGPMYANLAKHLEPDQPLVGITLEPSDLEGLEFPYRLEDLCKLLARAVREAQPRGPYHLAGWCLSGVIAYETARQLTLGGDRVALVALLDSANIRYYRDLSATARAAFFARKMVYHFDQLRRWKTAPQYAGQLVEELIQKCRRMKLRLDGYRNRWGYAERLDPAAAGFLAAQTYSAQPYDGRVVSLIPAQRPGGDNWNFSTSWREGASRLETRVVPGTHASMFEEPNVKTLAHHLTECLRGCQKPLCAAGGEDLVRREWSGNR